MVNDSLVTQRLREFDAAHGSDAVQIGNYFVYSDGAAREYNPLGVLEEPSPDPRKRIKVQIEYWEERVRMASERFKEFREQLALAGKSCLQGPAPHPWVVNAASSLQRLQDLRQDVQDCQCRLDTIREWLQTEKTPATLRMEKELAANRQRGEAFLEELKTITI